MYGHGSEILVEIGDEVTQGTPVLKIGSTGVSTGPHAHFEVRINGNFMDPLDYFEQDSNVDIEINDEELEEEELEDEENIENEEDIEDENTENTEENKEEDKEDNDEEVHKYGPIIYA